MKNLINGCSYSELWVSPENWAKTKSQKSLNEEWYVQCYYYDPQFRKKYPKGFPFRRKLNKIKDLDARKEAVRIYLEEIPKLFEESHFNPITKRYMVDHNNNAELSEETPCSEAIEYVWKEVYSHAVKELEKAGNYIENYTKPYQDIKVAKNRFVKGLIELKLDKIPIKELSISQVKQTMKHLAVPDGSIKKFRSYMSKLWTELFEYDVVENNPFTLFKSKKPKKKIRETITEENFDGIVEYLHENCYTFYRYGMIFHMSGARTSELFMLQKKHIDLDNQEYRVWVKKGDQYTEEIKVIMLEGLHLWKEVLSECNSDDDFLFSKGLVPGSFPIEPRQISIRWKRHIKTNYSNLIEKKIDADFYTLKHLFLDRLDKMQHEQAQLGAQYIANLHLPNNIAQIHASHKSPNITNAVYLTNKADRERQILKTVDIQILKRAV